MEKTISEFMETLFGCAVFASAIILLAAQARYVEKGQDVTTHYVESSAVLSVSERWEHAEPTITYSELCAHMMRGIPCDVSIDGQLVEKQWFNANTFDYSIIRAGHSYRVTYEYNTDGTLKHLVYVSV